MGLDVIWTSALDATDGAAYERFVDGAEGGHFAQARAWAKVACAGRMLKAQYFLAREKGRILGAALVLRLCAGANDNLETLYAAIEDGTSGKSFPRFGSTLLEMTVISPRALRIGRAFFARVRSR